jgi:hypothetical protein
MRSPIRHGQLKPASAFLPIRHSMSSEFSDVSRGNLRQRHQIADERRAATAERNGGTFLQPR